MQKRMAILSMKFYGKIGLEIVCRIILLWKLTFHSKIGSNLKPKIYTNFFEILISLEPKKIKPQSIPAPNFLEKDISKVYHETIFSVFLLRIPQLSIPKSIFLSFCRQLCL